MPEPIKRVEEYVGWLRALQGRMIIYRGLADADWDVESSAYRRIRKSEDFAPETPSRGALLRYISHQLDDAGLLGFRNRPNGILSDLELLAELQHFGAATCLIDFTSSAFIALYFACREETEKVGKVVAMPTDDIDRFSTINYEDLNKTVSMFLFEDRLWKWKPSSLNNRIVAQQSVIVFGEGRIGRNDYEEITINAASKRDILATLEESFGINERQLFNDLPGYARINAHNQPYNKITAEDFAYLGTVLHQRGEYEQAIERFDKAIELKPKWSDTYKKRGSAKHSLSDLRGAILDYNRAIELFRGFTSAYYSRGNAMCDLGDPRGAIVDYNRALELDPNFARAYHSRGIAKRAIGDETDAKKDFDKASEIDPGLRPPE